MNVRAEIYGDNTGMIGLPVASAPPKHGVGRARLERQAVYLERFALCHLKTTSGDSNPPTSVAVVRASWSP